MQRFTEPCAHERQGERIAHLRTELTNVRSGIQRIVTGLHELGDDSAMPSQTNMAGHPSTQPLPRTQNDVFPGNVENTIWPPTTAPSYTPLPENTGLLERMRTAERMRAAEVSYRPPPSLGHQRSDSDDLRARQRRFLESGYVGLRLDPDQQRYGIRPSGAYNNRLVPSPTFTTTTQAPGEPTIGLRSTRNPRSQRPPVFGTREEIESPGYQSPPSLFYGRAWENYRTAEEIRSAARRAEENRTTARMVESLEATGEWNDIPVPRMPADSLGPPVMYNHDPVPHGHLAALVTNRQSEDAQDLQERMAGLRNSIAQIQTQASEGLPNARRLPVSDALAERAGIFLQQRRRIRGETSTQPADPGTAPPYYIHPFPHSEEHYTDDEFGAPALNFDNQDRPEALAAEAMVVNIACRICQEHLVDTIVIPCGHAVMCNWCADLEIPGRPGQPNIPKNRSAKCPICRNRVKQKMKIYLS